MDNPSLIAGSVLLIAWIDTVLGLIGLVSCSLIIFGLFFGRGSCMSGVLFYFIPPILIFGITFFGFGICLSRGVLKGKKAYVLVWIIANCILIGFLILIGHQLKILFSWVWLFLFRGMEICIVLIQLRRMYSRTSQDDMIESDFEDQDKNIFSCQEVFPDDTPCSNV